MCGCFLLRLYFPLTIDGRIDYTVTLLLFPGGGRYGLGGLMPGPCHSGSAIVFILCDGWALKAEPRCNVTEGSTQ